MIHCNASERGNLLFLGLHPWVGKNKNNHPHEIKGFLQRLEEQSWWLVLWVSPRSSTGLQLGASRPSSCPSKRAVIQSSLVLPSVIEQTAHVPVGALQSGLLDIRQRRWTSSYASTYLTPQKHKIPRNLVMGVCIEEHTKKRQDGACSRGHKKSTS